MWRGVTVEAIEMIITMYKLKIRNGVIHMDMGEKLISTRGRGICSIIVMCLACLLSLSIPVGIYCFIWSELINDGKLLEFYSDEPMYTGLVLIVVCFLCFLIFLSLWRKLKEMTRMCLYVYENGVEGIGYISVPNKWLLSFSSSPLNELQLEKQKFKKFEEFKLIYKYVTLVSVISDYRLVIGDGEIGYLIFCKNKNATEIRNTIMAQKSRNNGQ
jgi:hypothetical protein